VIQHTSISKAYPRDKRGIVERAIITSRLEPNTAMMHYNHINWWDISVCIVSLYKTLYIEEGINKKKVWDKIINMIKI